jgi:energy-converting hydrogenase Eha subunit C
MVYNIAAAVAAVAAMATGIAASIYIKRTIFQFIDLALTKSGFVCNSSGYAR